MTATLEQLVKVRSQLAEQLAAYLEKIAVSPVAKDDVSGVQGVAYEIRMWLSRLQAQTIGVDDLPVFVPLDLVKLATQPQRDPAGAILDYLEEQFRISGLVRHWIEEALPTSRCRLLVRRGNGGLTASDRSKLIELLETIRSQGWDVTGSIVIAGSAEAFDNGIPSLLQPKTLIRNWFAPFIVSRHQNLDFAGREMVLDKLKQALNSNGAIAVTQRGISRTFTGGRRQALSGLGGIGKTAVAVEYAYRFRSEYDAIIFVRADQAETLTKDYEVVCSELGLEPRVYIPNDSDRYTEPRRPLKDLNPAVRAVLHWLDINDGWLLIVDNVEEPNLVSRFLPNMQRGHILVTSRSQHLAGLGIRVSEPLVLDGLSPEEADNLLWKRIGRRRNVEPPDELHAAREIVRLLDGLPLALESAAGMIRECQYTFGQYLRLWQERGAEVLDYDEALDADHPESTVRTFLLAFEKIKQQAKDSARHALVPDLLRFMAFLSPDEIPFTLLIACAQEISADFTRLGDPAGQEIRLKELLTLPKRFSFIDVDAEKKICRIHRLVQEVLRNTMKPEKRLSVAKQTIAALNRYCPILGASYGNWVEVLNALPHAYAISSILLDPFRRDDFNFDAAAELLSKTGMVLTSLGRPEQTGPLLERAVEIRDSDRNLKWAEAICFKADALEDLSQHEEARALYFQALETRIQFLGEWSTDVGQIYNNLGLSYFNVWDNDEAETYYQKAREIWKRSRDRVLEGHALHNLAMLHKRLGKSDTEQLFRDAADRIEANKNMVPKAWHHLGDHLVSIGKNEEGERYLEKAQLLWEKFLGKDSAQLVQLLEDRADALEKLGRRTEAAELRKRAQEIRRRNK